jgi:hypothetical protein
MAKVVVAQDALHWTEYNFLAFDQHIYLESVVEFERPTTRHKGRPTEKYSRLAHRSPAEPELPAEIIQQAEEAIRAQMVFRKWPRKR